MINKILLLAFLIFPLLYPLHSQTSWSEPVRVSGIYWCTDPALSVDNNGVMSALWLKHIKLDVGYYSTVNFSQSFNGGLNWTSPVNITPESTSVLWETRAVTDSKNNIHIIYAKGLESKVLVYKKYDGISWTGDLVVNVSLDANMRFGIDNTERLFATWMLSRTTYYMYCDTNTDSIAWSTPKKIHPIIDYTTKDFTFDKDGNVHGIQRIYLDDGITYDPFVSKYNRVTDIWEDFREIYDSVGGYGCAMAYSQKDSLYANINSSIDQQLQKYITDSLWSDPIGNGSSNNNINRIMFIGRDNMVHIFQVNEENDIHSLNHTYGKGAKWQTETIHTDPDYYIPWFDVKRKVFEEHDEYYVLYGKSGNINGTPTNRINFQKKSISTGISEDSENIPGAALLYQNYPNPFNNSTEISYSLNQPSIVKVNIFNIKGEFVKILINQKQNKGQHSILFNADCLNSGIYYYQLEIDGAVKDTKKMLYLK
jgi:hypothetical protein